MDKIVNDYSLGHRRQRKRLSPMHDIVGSILSLPTHMKYCNWLSQRNVMMLLLYVHTKRLLYVHAYTNKNMKNNVNKRWEFYVSFGEKGDICQSVVSHVMTIRRKAVSQSEAMNSYQ